MGLTIHWSLQGPPLKADAKAVIEKMRQRAMDLPLATEDQGGEEAGSGPLNPVHLLPVGVSGSGEGGGRKLGGEGHFVWETFTGPVQA
jgi:hypothetical protein